MMIPSLLKIYDYNKSHNLKDISIFEIGKGFYKKNGEYGENNKLCLLMSGDYFLGVDNTRKVDFYVVKGIVEEILDYLGYGNRYSFVKNGELPEEFHPGQTAYISVNNDIVGIMGKLHPEVAKDVYVMEINLDKLLEKKVGKMKYKEISKFPGVSKDLAIVVDKNILAKDIENVINRASSNLLSEIKVFDVYTGANLGINKKSIAFNLYFEAKDRTLTDEEINKEIDNIIKAVENKLNAEIRK